VPEGKNELQINADDADRKPTDTTGKIATTKTLSANETLTPLSDLSFQNFQNIRLYDPCHPR
jgi:hypothetical protein